MNEKIIKNIFKNFYRFSVQKELNSVWSEEINQRSCEDYDPCEYVYENMHGDDIHNDAELIEEWAWDD